MDHFRTGPLYAYLGANPHNEFLWDDDLVIELEHEGPSEDGVGTRWGARPGNEDVAIIRKRFWCAARAKITLCSEKCKPILLSDGSPASTRLELGYEGDYQQVYETILEEMTRGYTPAHLSNPFERYLDFEEIRQASKGSLAYELYKRLLAILPDLEKMLRSIVHRPATQLVPRLAYYEYAEAELENAMHQIHASVKIHRVHEVKHFQGYMLPSSFTAVFAEESTHSVANQFVAQSVYRIKSLISFVQEHLQQEEQQLSVSNAHHKLTLAGLEEIQHRFSRYQTQLPPVQPWAGSTTEAMVSSVMSYDARYAQLRRLTNLLDQALRHIDRSHIPFEVHAFHKLYEQWCFFKVVHALLDLGFAYERGSEMRSTLFYHHPIPNQINCILSHPRLPDMRLEVWYDRAYTVLRSSTDAFDKARPYGVENRSWTLNKFQSSKNKPDIVLEFHEEDRTDRPMIVTLDPTLRKPQESKHRLNQRHEEKYFYLETVRSFVERNIHTGESVRLVKAAWGIWPGRLDNPKTHTLDEGDFERGFIHLRPDNHLEEALPLTIKKILAHAGITV